MTRIDEWNPVLPPAGGPSQAPDGGPPPPAGSAPDLVGAIYRGLMAMPPPRPVAVHFYLGEGWRWIRVGFDGDAVLAPAAVAATGRVIEACTGESGPLFFHALRPYDMLFFLEGGAAESIGLPADWFGAPLAQVLQAWGIEAPRRSARGHSRSAAPYSQRSSAKR